MKVGGKIAEFNYPIEETWTRIAYLFAERGIECEFVYGPHSEKLEGSPPRIQFQRTDGEASFAGMRSGGNEFARITQACVARVWGVRPDEDFEKHQCIATLDLVIELIGAIYYVCAQFPNGLNGLGITFTQNTPVDRYGIQFEVNWQYSAPICLVTEQTYRAVVAVEANLVRA